MDRIDFIISELKSQLILFSESQNYIDLFLENMKPFLNHRKVDLENLARKFDSTHPVFFSILEIMWHRNNVIDNDDWNSFTFIESQKRKNALNFFVANIWIECKLHMFLINDVDSRNKVRFIKDVFENYNFLFKLNDFFNSYDFFGCLENEKCICKLADILWVSSRNFPEKTIIQYWYAYSLFSQSSKLKAIPILKKVINQIENDLEINGKYTLDGIFIDYHLSTYFLLAKCYLESGEYIKAGKCLDYIIYENTPLIEFDDELVFDATLIDVLEESMKLSLFLENRAKYNEINKLYHSVKEKYKI